MFSALCLGFGVFFQPAPSTSSSLGSLGGFQGLSRFCGRLQRYSGANRGVHLGRDDSKHHPPFPLSLDRC